MLYSSFVRFLPITHLCGKEFVPILSLIFNITFLFTYEQNYSYKNGYFLCWSYSQKYPPPFSVYAQHHQGSSSCSCASLAAPHTACLACLFLGSQVFLNLVDHYQLETWDSITTITNMFLIFTERQGNENLFLISDFWQIAFIWGG